MENKNSRHSAARRKLLLCILLGEKLDRVQNKTERVEKTKYAVGESPRSDPRKNEKKRRTGLQECWPSACDCPLPSPPAKITGDESPKLSRETGYLVPQRRY